MTLSNKDPEEIINVFFDYAELAAAVTSPVVSIQATAGKEDAAAASMLSGAAETTGAVVRQTIIGGQAGTSYTLRCLATLPDGTKYLIPGLLPVAIATP